MNKKPDFIKSELKQEILKYFEGIQFEIDTHAQQGLAKIAENDEEDRQSILSRNEEMITLVKDVMNLNMKRINEYDFKMDSLIEDEQIFKKNLRKDLFTNYCFYGKYETSYKCENRIAFGLLVITDWYLDKNQLAFLNSKIQKVLPNDDQEVVLNFDSDVVNLYHYVSNNVPMIYNGKILRLEKRAVNEELARLSYFKIDMVQTITINSFSSLTNLEWLDVAAGFICDIDKNAFQHLKNLKQLTLYMPGENERNQHYPSSLAIQSGTFNQQFQLRTLIITISVLEKIEDDTFKSLVNLKFLLISSPKLKSISKKTLNGLKNLEELTINEDLSEADVDLAIDEDTFEELINLKSLGFYVNKLPNINEKLFGKLINVETLNIYVESVDKIEKNSFGELKSLQSLSIRSKTNSKKILDRDEIADLNIKNFFGLSENSYLKLILMEKIVLSLQV